jgi:hypothetical protein
MKLSETLTFILITVLAMVLGLAVGHLFVIWFQAPRWGEAAVSLGVYLYATSQIRSRK